MIDCLLGMHKILGSVPSTLKKKGGVWNPSNEPKLVGSQTWWCIPAREQEALPVRE